MDRVRRPNILLIMTDQHRWDHVGFNGNTVVSTPNLDALAAEGTVFPRTYVANPTCSPNRAALLTGRSPSAHGLRVNGMPLALDTRTIADSLSEAGYTTHHIGKSHLQPYGITVEREAPGSERVGELDQQYRWEDRARHEQEQVEMPDSYYGFQRVELTCGHGDNVGGHYTHWLRAHGVEPDEVRGPANAIDQSTSWEQVYQTAVPTELYPSTFVAERAEAAIREYAASNTPFMVIASFPDPHHPFTPPGEYWSMYNPDDMPMPDSFDAEHMNIPPHIENMRDASGVGGHEYTGWAPTAEQYREALAAEYGMITLIDDCVGRIIAALDDAGVRDDTVVIFTSDHGDLFGDHGLMFKHALHYEGCIRVPLMISGAGVGSGRDDTLVSTLDIGPTIVDLADAAPLPGAQGQSLIGHRGRKERTEVLIEEDELFSLPGLPGPIRMRTVVTDDGRLTMYAGSETHGELYSTADDPLETVNLFGNSQHSDLETRLRDRLLHAMMGADDTARLPHFAG